MAGLPDFTDNRIVFENYLEEQIKVHQEAKKILDEFGVILKLTKDNPEAWNYLKPHFAKTFWALYHKSSNAVTYGKEMVKYTKYAL